MSLGSTGADISYRSLDSTHHSFDPHPSSAASSQHSAHRAQAPSDSQDIARGITPSSEGIRSWANLSPGASHHLPQNHSPGGTRAALPQQSSSSMNVPNLSFYDPDQVVPPEETETYQQWVQSYYAQAQAQAQDPQQYGMPQGSQQPGMSHLSYETPSHVQQHHPSMSAPSHPSMQQQRLSNQYNFVPSQYMPPQQHQQPMSSVYNQGYPPGQSVNRTSLVAPRISRQVPRPANVAATGFPAQSRHPQPLQRAAMPMGYQHAPHPQQYPQTTPQQEPMEAASYFQNMAPSDISSIADASRTQNFTFYHPSPADARLTPGSNASYTPNSETNPLPQSGSPSPWASADDSASQPTPVAHISATASAQSASTSPPVRRNPTASGKGRTKKRLRPNPVGEMDSGSDEEDDLHASMAVPPLRGPDSNPARLPGACTYCRRLKMKCDFPKGENTCKRCKASGHHCIVEGRKPRNAPNKREYLLAQIRQKDAIIESLLKQLHNPYLATPLSIASYRMATSPSDQNKQNVLTWLDRLEDSVRTAGRSGGSQAFKLDSRAQGSAEEESESENEEAGETTERGSVGTVKVEEDDIRQSLPDTAVPLGLIADLAINNTKKTSTTDEDDADEDNVGVANETYFLPGPAWDLDIRANLIEQHSPPDILVHGLVTPEDVDKLFEIFYARLNVHVSVLDPVLHTPSTTFARCPFLFTVVCAVASRYYNDKSEIYPIAMHFAKHAAANALITGWKSVELAQAYILLSIYGVPARRWEEDRGWLYTGLAIRIATDLNLHHIPSTKPTSERQEREIINRIRVWLNCYNLDKSTATQFGKHSTIKEDYIVRKSDEWYKRSQFNHPYDIGLCGYTSQLRIMAGFHEEVYSDPDSSTGLNERLDFKEVTSRHDQLLTGYFNDWKLRFEEESDMSDPACAFRSKLLPFFTNYSRLVMYSFGFQQAFRRGMQAEDRVYVDKCFQAAKAVITSMVDGLAPTGFLRYSPDSHFIFGTFASAFLLKLLKPEFSSLITKDQEGEIFELIGRLIQTLNSVEIAIDDRHTPRLHARFLAGLLSRHRRDVATTGRLHAQQPPPQAQYVMDPSSSNMGVGGSQQVFSVSPLGGGSSTQTSAGQPPHTESVLQAEPVYEAEAAYTHETGPIEVLEFASSPGSTDDEMLGALLALKNPSYWSNMMMPGFQWSEPRMSEQYVQQPQQQQDQPYPDMFNDFEFIQAPALQMA